MILPISIASGQVWDVGPVSLPSPPDIIEADSTYPCSTMVKNFSSQPASGCSAICTIGSWADTVTGISIDHFDSVWVVFSDWTVPPGAVYTGSYRVAVSTLSDADTNAANNTLSKTVYIPTDTLIVVSDTGYTSQKVRISLELVNPFHAIGGIDIGVFLSAPAVAHVHVDTLPGDTLMCADYTNGVLSEWEWLTSHSPSPTTAYLDAIAENGSPPFTSPLYSSSERRLFAELLVDIDEDAPGPYLPHDWAEVDDDFGSQTWTRYETNPRTGDACVSVAAEPFWQNKDWLITPQLSVSSHDSLKFWYRVEDESYPEEIEVRLSLSDSDIGSFTSVLWTSSLTNTGYLEKRIDLSSYAGEIVYIAFVCNSLNKRRLYIDDVSGPGLSQGFETASTAIGFSITSLLVDSTGYVHYLPIRIPGVLYAEAGLCGDANGDGKITFADALCIKNYYYQTPPGSPPPIGEGDVNLDGKITFADALYIKNYYYQTPPGSPPPCEPSGLLNLYKKGGEKKKKFGSLIKGGDRTQNISDGEFILAVEENDGLRR